MNHDLSSHCSIHTYLYIENEEYEKKKKNGKILCGGNEGEVKNELNGLDGKWKKRVGALSRKS